MSAQPDFRAMKAAGAKVSDLRKHKATAAQIREAGFTLAEMQETLGVHLLKEAFSLSELNEGGIPLQDILTQGFTLSQALSSGYSLRDACDVLSGEQIRAAGIKLSDIAAASAAPYWLLRHLGFSKEEMEAAGMPRPPPVSPPPPVACSMLSRSVDASEVAALNVGDSINVDGTGPESTELHVRITRLSEAEASALAKRPSSEWLSKSSYGYEGSGRRCPACGHPFVLVEKSASSNGMAGVESATYVCETAGCCIKKRESYEGYGTIFFSWKDL